MQITDSNQKFGLVTKLLHWGIFLLFCAQYFLVYRRDYLPKDSAESTQYILLHKSFGVIVLGMALFFIIWRKMNARPTWPASMTTWQKRLAKLVHWALYLAMFIMPISGILMSQFHGYPVSVFGHEIPTLVSTHKHLSEICFLVHKISSFAIIGIVGLHALGALTHHFYYKDDVLKKML